MTISTTNEDKYVPHGRLLFFVPVVAFAGIAVAFAIGLTLNPQEIPSALIGKEVPEFALPPVKGRALSLSSTDLKGEILLVNVFASWCVECRAEHPLLMNQKPSLMQCR
ncbi:MAG: redoxin domain-containing protein [Rhodospirillales bacterium]|jgi:cytochrome c biogenesis protein CcmG, thiol:disulfide interchange protein DsbE|nr:redoxin domain-containing protein [Rhodospirillales bacterium]